MAGEIELLWIPVSAALLALLTMHFLRRWLPGTAAAGRRETLDGIRGFLAIGVFLHHGMVWWQYLRTGKWVVPSSRLFVHLGQASVMLFFMTTGFLFFTKLIEGRTKPVGWGALFRSRARRILPMHLVVVAVVFELVALRSGDELRVPVVALVRAATTWVLFGFPHFGVSDLNGLTNTFTLNAGVLWSLQYEAWFYLALPLLALGFGLRPPWRFLLPGAASVLIVWRYAELPLIGFVPFLGGLAAAMAARSNGFRRVAATPWGSVAALAGLIAVGVWFPTSFQPGALALLAAVFALVAGGADFFGLLRLPASRALGEVSYSLYLVHGLLLFTTFNFVIGAERASHLSFVEHYSLVLAVVPVLVALSTLTYVWIEHPWLRRSAPATVDAQLVAEGVDPT